MEHIDAAYQKFKTLLTEIAAYGNSIFSEQDARVKIVDRILIEVLGYNYPDFTTESRAGKGFIDYKVNLNSISKLIIEAKKEGIDFDIDQSYSGRAFNLNGPVFSDKSVQDGLDQAIYYCAYKGVELACLTNGKTWIIFRANRQGDGKDVLEGKGFVFSTLHAIEREFKLFYELLSPSHVENHFYRALFQEAEGAQIRKKQFSRSLKTENSITVATREQYSRDFDQVMNQFFSRLSGDLDPDMLVDCFVETKESRIAEQNLCKVAESIINRIKPLDTEEAAVLQTIIEKVQATNRHEFVVLIGGKGAGKSTFIDRFFKYILPEKLQEHCVVIRINVSESDGNIATIIDWLNYTLLEECEQTLFQGKPSYNDLQGMFYNDYDRLRTGSWSHLYQQDKEQFKVDFGKRIEERREQRPNEYIKRMIGDITRSREKIPCIIFDNTDHFSIDFQEKVFQYARSIFEKEICLIILPITDKTSWQLSKQGSIQSFENEALYLPTPAPKKIIEKRIEFLESKLKIEKATKGQYFFKRGIPLEIQSIEDFVKYLQNVFLTNDNVSKWIGSLANYDIRRCLELTRDTISSPHLSMRDFLQAYVTGTGSRGNDEGFIKPYRIKNALIKKIYNSYPISNHSYVQNMFYITGNVNTSPLLAVRILQCLMDRKHDRSDDNYLEVDQILNYLNGMGIDRSITMKHLEIMLRKGLVFSYDPTVLSINDSKRLEISPSGVEHYLWALNDNDYLNIMLEVTQITNEAFFKELEKDYYNWGLGNIICQHKFLSYLEQEDRSYCNIPDHIAYKGQHLILTRLAWRVKIIASKIQSLEHGNLK